MKTCIFKATALAVALASGTPALADGFKPILTEDAFRTQVVGKRLLHGEDHMTFRANGQLAGNFGGKRLKGGWAWRERYWCRTLTTHSKNTDCQTWETDGRTFRVKREFGKGGGFEYTLR
ncbi:hypothetical protein [uncultured Tateyamaria sp.]|uniref:hypothetical protein n=1 Tax=uncultured Tateyamaria sp. TaxID=455651 RepID=UPI0026254C2A|nr:hypothetical protein [uncultured Tateyamaria sp.]